MGGRRAAGKAGKAGREEEARAMVTGETGKMAPECPWQGG